MVSPSMSIPWYSFCAICMVLEAPKPHFPEATCCKVEVVKGALGFLLKTCEAMLEIKYSLTNEQPFNRMKVRLKREIVTMGDETINPAKISGKYINPEEWNTLISDPEVLVIDTRNKYETEIGRFKNAIDPRTNSFIEFPKWVEKLKKEIDDPNKKIAMYCTGGIRC